MWERGLGSLSLSLTKGEHILRMFENIRLITIFVLRENKYEGGENIATTKS
jgi:hypothetical protein